MKERAKTRGEASQRQWRGERRSDPIAQPPSAVRRQALSTAGLQSRGRPDQPNPSVGWHAISERGRCSYEHGRRNFSHFLSNAGLPRIPERESGREGEKKKSERDRESTCSIPTRTATFSGPLFLSSLQKKRKVRLSRFKPNMTTMFSLS